MASKIFISLVLGIIAGLFLTKHPAIAVEYIQSFMCTTAFAITIVLTATLTSIGTAGVPGAGMIMLTMVLTAVGLPSEGIAQFSRILQDRVDAMNGRCTVPLFLLKRSSPKKKHNLQVYPTSCVLHLSH